MEKLELKIRVVCREEKCKRTVLVNPCKTDEGEYTAICPKCHCPAFISKEIPKSVSPERKKEKGPYFVNL